MSEILLDDPKPMSQSLLWNLQKDAYTQFGIQAWGKHRVPFYITSNCFTAKCYAYVVMGYIRDIVNQGAVDPAHPIHIIDLGAGTGRFGYFFLVELMRFLETSSLKHIKIRYVLTDISEDNMAFWLKHPLMKPFFERGVLDYAYFEHSQTEPLHLRLSNEVLSKENVVNPMVVIANYFFDTIPHDLFRVKDGVLEEGKVILTAKKNEGDAAEVNIHDPAIINQLKCQYTYSPVENSNYYADARLNVILEEYRKEFNDCTFLFPIGGLQSINAFVDHSSGRMMLLSGDHGACSDQQLQEGGEPQLALHGSFSFGVNFNAITRYFRSLGGFSHTAFTDTVFGVVACVLGKKAVDYPELNLAFQEQMFHYEPRDYWKLVSQAEDKWKTPTMEHMIIVLKLGNSDSMSFQAFFNRIREVLPSASDRQKQQLYELIKRTKVYFYPVNEESGNFILNMGVLLYDLHHHRDSLEFFEYALEITGPNATVLKNMAICHRVLGDEATALALEAQAAPLPELM